MKNCTGIIISTDLKNNYGGLSKSRPDYMLPFGSRYRLIDFALSNMSNYNLAHVMLYAGSNVRSTLDHIGDGKSWEMNRRNNGLMINPPAFSEWTRQQSAIQTYFDSLTYYEQADQDNIYIKNPMTITKVNLNHAYDEFIDHNYDVMLLYKRSEDSTGKYNGMTKIIMNSDGKFLNIGMNLGTQPHVDLYIGDLFIKKNVFMDLVKDSMEKSNATNLIQAISAHKNRLDIGLMEIDSHIEIIHDLVSYYEANMNLLNREIYQEIFYKGGMVYTKSKDEPSTVYRTGARVSNSLVANGCKIQGQVENCIVFRGVEIEKGAIVRNSILNQGTVVKADSVMVNCITDKYATIESGVTIMGSTSAPYVVGKNQVIRG